MRSTYNPFPGSTWTVGLDSLISQYEKLNKQEANYPPHNLIQRGEDTYFIEIAVAGFSADDITVEQEENVLTISSEDKIEKEPGGIIHKGIATRKFKKQFTLGDYIEVTQVDLENGILTVKCERHIPEEKKPKKFAINHDGPKDEATLLTE